ncbi:MFS transporter [Vibrio galatheae]|uniref:MFS transporter n=1 Tax=Vibrio galatheae TaxID=579748 RepID=UPI0005F9B24B|nr:MFS transporter [Vibrio galatheae]
MTQSFPANRWQALLYLLLANFLNILDVTIVNVAIPRIYLDMDISPSQAQWVSVIYLTGFAACLLPFGKLGDMYGKVRLFQLGLIAFIVTSLLCSMSPNIETLVFSRLAQGIASALMVPQVLAIAVTLFPDQEKVRMFGYIGMVSSLASILGPVVGGGLITLDLFELDWRWVFLINIPIGAVAYFGVKHTLTNEVVADKPRIDWVGNGLVVLISVLFIVPMIEGYSLNWPAWLVVLLVMSVPSFILLNTWLKSSLKRGRPTLISKGLYQNRAFIRQIFFLMLFGTSTPGLFFVLTNYLQSHLLFTPFESGGVTFAFPLGVFIASALLKGRSARWQRYRIFAGCLVLTISWTLLYFSIGNVSSSEDFQWLMVPFLLGGLGMGSAIIALFQTIMGLVDSRDSGTASGAMQALQHVGMAVGIGLIGQIYFISLDVFDSALVAMKNSLLFCVILLSGFTLKSLHDLYLEQGMRFQLK